MHIELALPFVIASLFSLEDLWEVLKEYPAVRVKLESIAVKRLEKHKKPLIQQSETKKKRRSDSNVFIRVFVLRSLVNLKRSKSAPGLIEISCRLPFHAPVRRAGSGLQRLSCVKEDDINLLLSSANPSPLPTPFPPPPPPPPSAPSSAMPLLPSTSTPIDTSFTYPGQHASPSCHSSLSTAPLASSISFTSSLNSARPAIINHSVSWSTAGDTTKPTISNVPRTMSLMNSNLRSRISSTDSNEILRLKQRLAELEKEDLINNATVHQEYLDIQNRLKDWTEQDRS